MVTATLPRVLLMLDWSQGVMQERALEIGTKGTNPYLAVTSV